MLVCTDGLVDFVSNGMIGRRHFNVLSYENFQ